MKLNDSIETIGRLTPTQKKALAVLGIRKIGDLLRHFPTRYGNQVPIKSIEFLTAGEEAVLYGKISKLKTGKTFRGRVPIGSATIEDSTGKIQATWFSQPYIAKMFSEDTLVRIEGKVSQKKSGELSFINPKIEKATSIPEGTSDSLFGSKDDHSLSPTYPETRNISSNWIYHHIQKIFKSGILDSLEDPIPEILLKKYSLPSISTALFWIHAPRKKEDAEIARKRFAFEEIFLIQLDRQKERLLAERENTFKIDIGKEELEKFISDFEFPLTNAQRRCIDSAIADMKSGHPMSRLIEGDVGSGKTAVAASVCHAIVQTTPPNREYGSLQVAYMAPTEILAEQHFESFIKYFKKYNIPVGLITGSGAKKFPSKTNSAEATKISKPQMLKWVKDGQIPILIGTHALIQKSVSFKNLGLIVIDEQHRFGVKQRKELRKKQPARTTSIQLGGDIAPHLLSMTATPIPRTLALTLFGDLDLSILDELPPGRKPVETKIILPHQREEVYEKVREELKSGRQAYVICPRIAEADPARLDDVSGRQNSTSQLLNLRSVTEETKYLQEKIFPEYKIMSITGKMTPKEKEETMRHFKEGKGNILVATSVVEVGVNVPNATVIIIENAERFGLAQLHQLRGRVLRSSHKPYCFVFAQSNSQKTIVRLKSFTTAKNGFELAEADLKQRGSGDLFGNKQWGVSDLAMEALKNLKMVEFARSEARALLEEDIELSKFPILKKHLLEKTSVHME